MTNKQVTATIAKLSKSKRPDTLADMADDSKRIRAAADKAIREWAQHNEHMRHVDRKWTALGKAAKGSAWLGHKYI